MAGPQPLLVTKITRPQPRPNLVERPRLADLWRESGERPLTLVCAPAGYGKTTLVVDRLSGQPPETSCWLSLDESDNDPVQFWRYLIAALQTAVPEAGEQSLALLQSPQPPAAPMLLTFLVNDLAALPGPLDLVLDDYHFITNQAVHEGLAWLLGRLPPGIHLVLTCRADPPLPLARLRVRGQLVEIREKDLRFTAEETAAFMEQVIGLSLTGGQLQSLAERTEGWAAGLQLAGLAASGSDKMAEILQAFSGSHRHLVDYLTEEVLARQPEQVQAFLLQTAVLDRFCTPLCEAVLGAQCWELAIEGRPPVTDPQSLLEYLERANLFLIPLDEERRWYRYHHLFAGLLAFRAGQRLDKGLREDIHRRAAAWFAEETLWPEAIDHALAAGDVDFAGGIIAEQAAATIAHGGSASLKGWLAALPGEQIRAEPRLALAQSWVELFSGEANTAEQWLAPVLDHLQTAGDGDEQMLGEAMAVRATLAFARQETAPMIADSERALALLPPSRLPLRTLVSWHLAFTYRALGRTRLSLELYYRVIEMSGRSGNFLINLSARREVAELLISLGDPAAARRMLEELLAEAAAHNRLHLYPAAGAHLHLGEIFYEWNRLEEAVHHLQMAISLSQTPEMSFETYSYALLARAYAALRRRAEAAETVQQAELSVLQAAHAQRRILTLAHICAFWLGQGDAGRAAAWLPDGRDILHDPHNEVFARQETTRACYLLAVGDVAGAAEVVNVLLPAAETAGRGRDVVELLLLKRRLVEEAGEAETAVRRALALAEPGGLVRIFLDGGPAVGALLTRLKGQPDVPGPYLERLLGAFSLAAESSTNRLLAEPLSQRELEVLQLMAEGFSNREIAERLYFTVATAKKHAEHIYGKLGVNSRTQAITRAREWGVIS